MRAHGPASRSALRLSQLPFLLWDHPFKTSANFSQFLTPTPLPSAVFYYYPSANLANFWPLPPLKNADVFNGWSLYWLRGYDRSDLNVGITIFISFSLANKTKEGRNISNYLDNRVTCQQIVNFLHFDAFTVWPEPIWIKVKKSWLLLPQHQSTYPRGPISASIENPLFRPKFTL